jgi:hypothetical protein
MAVRAVVLNPTGENGYAVFFEHPKDGSAMVNVMTKNYIQRVLPLGNVMLTQQINMPPFNAGLKDYDPNKVTTLESIVKYTHDCFIKMGYKDRTPRFIEQVDILYDFNEQIYKESNDVQKSIIEIKKRYNLHMAGGFLAPAYPDIIPNTLLPPLPIPFIPLPSSPV